MAELYEGLPGPVFRVPVTVAEMTKYVDNSFHALKVGFANEIGAICKAAGVDSHEVMDVFKADRKLNISPAYLTPGMAFGGSCLPKDVRAIVHWGRHEDLDIPILESVLPSNRAHLTRAYDMVARSGRRRVGVLGLSFKSGTDDLRESPMVELSERLIGRGYDLRIHDANVALSQLLGANRAYIDAHIPHLSRLISGSVDEVLDHAEIALIGTRDAEVLEAVRMRPDLDVVDLVRIPTNGGPDGGGRYDGLCW